MYSIFLEMFPLNSKAWKYHQIWSTIYAIDKCNHYSINKCATKQLEKKWMEKKKGKQQKLYYVKKKMPIQVWGPSTPKPVYSSKYWRN